MKENISIINSAVGALEFHTSISPPLVDKSFFIQKQKLSSVIDPLAVVEARTVDEIITDTILGNAETQDSFFIADLGEVTRQYHLFKRLLPRITPFFAIKCNPDPLVIRTLLNLGTGFDCASKTEVETVLSMGAEPRNVIYANPCKQASHIRYAASQGVDTMTFDNLDELIKISNINPNAKLVLRILADDSRSLCKFGVKFGAALTTVPILLAKAKELSVNVIGISFHVGSGCYDACAFSEAVVLARKAFDMGLEYGFDFTLLDVGGGFPGQNNGGITFEQIAAALGPTVDKLFPPHVRVIAEPGRYFVSSAYTLAVNIVARRAVPRDIGVEAQLGKNEHPSFMYYVNDGVYGSFNCIMFDHYQPKPKVLLQKGRYYYKANVPTTEPVFPCSLWGPTCDSMDCITKKDELPELEVGDWLYFDNMGAYTNAAASCFNGFKKSTLIYTNTGL